MNGSKHDYEALLAEAIGSASDYAAGKRVNAEEAQIDFRLLPNIRKLREKLGVSQELFAAQFGVPIATVRNWEQGRRNPSGAARILCEVIDRAPEVVREVLEARVEITKNKYSERSGRTSLRDLLEQQLQDMYYAVGRISKELPRVAEQVHSEDFRVVLYEHQRKIELEVANLEAVFRMLGTPPQPEKDDAIEGILSEINSIMDQKTEHPDAFDAEIIAGVQAIGHYELSRYGTIVAWLQHLGDSEAAELLRLNLERVNEMDNKLSELANGNILKAGVA